jgi:hypothetical protein
MKRKRPELIEIQRGGNARIQPGQCCITMSVGQWDTMLEACYDLGWRLIELDKNEKLVAIYQREPAQDD